MNNSIVRSCLENFLSQHNNAALCVAFSGGLDSSVLLHALSQLEQARKIGLRGIHINHRLQANSGAWAQHARARGAQWQVALEVVAVTVDLATGTGMEAAAREARYKALSQHLASDEVLLTAHHRDDQIETMLLKLLRGGGCESLAAMRPERTFAHTKLIRPFLDLPRAEILAYAQAQQLLWIEDPSNSDTRHSRNRLRNKVLPVLREAFPSADVALASSAKLMQAEAIRLTQITESDFQQVQTAKPNQLNLSKLKQLDQPARNAALRHWFVSLRLPPPSPRHLVQIEKSLCRSRSDATPKVAWPGAELRRYRDRLFAFESLPPIPELFNAQWLGGSALEIPLCGSLRLLDTTSNPAQFPLGAVQVSLRKGGERLITTGHKQHHSVKNLLQESGVPPWLRERLPYLWRKRTLLAVGDQFISTSLQQELDDAGLRLQWQALH